MMTQAQSMAFGSAVAPGPLVGDQVLEAVTVYYCAPAEPDDQVQLVDSEPVAIVQWYVVRADEIEQAQQSTWSEQ
jgi:hypothetical protein